jgi:N,N'-diacetyllegionaminate synthase
MKNSINIGRRSVGSECPCLIIAEAGVNHNGDVELARRLIREAKRSGADCVKFQTFRAENVVSRGAPKAAYQLRSTDPAESQFEMLKKLELAPAAHEVLLKECLEQEVEFLSTPYGFEDVDLLDELGVPACKIASAQIIELPFLRYVAAKGKPVLLSTGMATLGEIEEAVEAIRSTGNHQIVLLQCTTNYPSVHEDAHLQSMETMRRAFDTLVGYSDHTVGPAAPVAAVAMGAVLIEKHFTIDKTLPGPDQSSSAEPAEFADMVRLIREAEASLGCAYKRPSTAEGENARNMRRSLMARHDIPAGQVINTEMLICKRPASGLPPKWESKVIGHRAARDILANTPLTLDSIDWRGVPPE